MITVRPAKVSDAPTIRKIQALTWLDTYPNQKYSITKKDILAKNFDSLENIAKTQKTIRTKGEWRLFVAEADGRVVGFCSSRKNSLQPEIGGTYVLPEYQHQGIGQQLLKKAFQYLGRDRKITCEVAIYNKKGVGFWQKMGFKIISQSQYALTGQKSIPTYKMEK